MGRLEFDGFRAFTDFYPSQNFGHLFFDSGYHVFVSYDNFNHKTCLKVYNDNREELYSVELGGAEHEVDGSRFANQFAEVRG